ncbi:MAG: hypothetical protein GY754_20860 [bacterium]|nr:hypothetical protein [bacterium]
MIHKQQFMAQHAAALEAAINSEEVKRLLDERDEAEHISSLGIHSKCTAFHRDTPPITTISIKFDFIERKVGIIQGDILVTVDVNEDCSIRRLEVEAADIGKPASNG